MAETKRRARGEDSIYYDRSRNRWTGTITVGWKPDGRRDRIIVRGRTKTEVKDKLRSKHTELAAGIRTPAHHTVEAGTVAVYRSVRGTGETKTEKSRRVFQIPEIAVEALRELVLKQAAPERRRGRRGRRTTQCFAPASVARCTQPMFGWSSSGSPRKRASAGTGRHGSCATPSSRSCQIPACPSNRSQTRWAIPEPVQRKSCTGTSSGR
jgi:hypothetical protein